MRHPIARDRALITWPAAMALLLALVLVGGASALGMPSDRQPASRQEAPAVLQDVSAIAGVEGDDACDLLTDEELLRASGARSVVARIPGPQAMMAAGCQVELEPLGNAYGQTWTVHLGVQARDGAARYDQDSAVGIQPGAGLGDRAGRLSLLGSWLGHVGDVAVSVHVVTFGGDPVRPSGDVARLLLWRILSRLEAGSPGPGPGADPSPPPMTPARALVERLRSASFDADVVDAAVEILARSGVATFAAPEDADPVMPITVPESPMALLLDQVRAMALEAWAGGGLSGADLDALAPADPELGDGAAILAGYVAAVDTEGAMVARELMGEVDWSAPQAAIFPQLVLVLMVSDVAREHRTESTATSHARPQPVRSVALAITEEARTAQGGACSAVTGFIDAALTRVFDSLRLEQPSGTVGRVVVAIWNFVIGLAEPAARRLVKELTQPVLDRIATVAGTVGLASLIVSAIRPWTLSVTSEPRVTVKGVDGSPGQAGQLVVRVELGGLDEWPAHIKDCARVAGRTLPNLKPEGAPVTWSAIVQAPDGLVGEGPRAARLDARGTARFDFTTLVDDIAAPWEDRVGHIAVAVTVKRPALEQLRQLAIDQLLGQLPSIVRGPLVPWLRPIVDRLTSRLSYLISTQVSGRAAVIHHVPAPTPRPGVTPEPTVAPRAVMVRVDRSAEPPLLAGRVLDLVSCDGPYGAWSGVLRVAGVEAGDVRAPFVELPLRFTFSGSDGVQSANATVSGTLVAEPQRLTSPFSFDLTIVVDGRTMSLSGRLATTLPAGVDATAVSRGSLLHDLPIVPAPPGTCP